MFARYAVIVKNLRGVLLFDLEEDGVKDKLDWLVKRFRYRNLGITPTLLSKYYNVFKDRLNGKPFRELVYPIEELEGVVDFISRAMSIPLLISEALAFSSIYISPLLLIGDAFRKGIEDNSITIIRTCREMDLKSWKLHLRIADYSILDMYEKNVSEALEVVRKIRAGEICEEEFSQVIENRVKRVEKDSKRFWRIKRSEGRPFLYYVDPLQKIILKVVRGAINVDELSEEYAASFTIIPTVYI